MAPSKIDYVATGLVTELPDGQTFLMVTITITCPGCGEITMELPGHHLRAIRDTLVEMVDRFPSLCNLDDELEIHRITHNPTQKES